MYILWNLCFLLWTLFYEYAVGYLKIFSAPSLGSWGDFQVFVKLWDISLIAFTHFPFQTSFCNASSTLILYFLLFGID